MNRVGEILKSWKQKIFQDLSVDEAFRYLAVIDKIKQCKVDWGSILEIGSGDLGITPYLKNTQITGLDQSFSDKPSTLKRVVGSATNLPFADNSFDTVLSVDCLEHIPHQLHSQVFAEIFRVAKKQVVISLPCGGAAYRLDKKLDSYYLNKFGQRHHFLKEHVDNGQVRQSEIEQLIQNGLSANNKLGQISSWSVINVFIRRMYMMLSFQRAIFFRALYYLLLVFVPFRRFFNLGDCYWRLFIVKIDQN